MMKVKLTYLVGVYWGPREESRQSCADRLSMFLHALAAREPALSQWFKKANSRKAAHVALPNDTEGLMPLLKTNRGDIGGEVIADLGFSFSAWTGSKAGMTASLAASCGMYTTVVPNCVVVSFEPRSTPTLELLQDILRSAVAAFDPDDGVVCSDEALSANASLPVWETPSPFRYQRGAGFLEG